MDREQDGSTWIPEEQTQQPSELASLATPFKHKTAPPRCKSETGATVLLDAAGVK